MKYIVAASSLAIGVCILWPDADLATSHVFYVGGGKFIAQGFDARVAREIEQLAPLLIFSAMLLAFLACRAGLCARRYAPSGRSLLFLALSLALGPGVLVNGVLKQHVHRPRPVHVRDFGGPDDFRPAGTLDGGCARNCSFPSGEAAAAFWTVAPANLAPSPWRGVALAAALLFGAAASLLRVAAGAHFLSDVIFAALIMLALIAVLRAILWPRRKRMPDELQEVGKAPAMASAPVP